MTKHSLLTILFMFLPFLMWAQGITGKVVDSQRKGIEGVYVAVVGKNIHSHADAKGNFRIEQVAIGDSLLFSHYGYETEVFELKNLQSPIQMIMEEKLFELDDIVISSDIKTINVIADIDLQVAPVRSSQEILRKVPGLIIGQHAGGGKAEQIFLRGFDIDHGTDVGITVDGLPVNMVSHAHGQGYADLHFLIPETVDKIDFGKGPYYAPQGNFTTAGYVDFRTRNALDRSSIQLELGQFNTFRTLGMFDIMNSDNHQAYVASEFIRTDGFFDASQNFNRINVFGKYSAQLPNNSTISVLASYFDSKWDASGQIPVRSVERGQINRFGAIDSTEGGFTGRTNLKVDYNKYFENGAFIKNAVFFSTYDFELYSNFTFFLNNPVAGDQIRQKEVRKIFGASSEFNLPFSNGSHLLQIGTSMRHDQSMDNELSRSQNRRTTLSRIQLGDIYETNTALYGNVELRFGKWLINPGLRIDHFNFNYNDALSPTFQAMSQNKAIVSPKLNLLYTHSTKLQAYWKAGKSFHSNDTRVVLAQEAEEILPGAYGSDLGFIWKPIPKLFINAAAWYLYLEQEFVYVGDEGIVEPSGETERYGLDLGLRYQLGKRLFLNVDANYSHARSVEDPEGSNFIPLALVWTSTGGLSGKLENGLYGSINYRYIADRPANEDNSIIAEGYSIVDMNVGYSWRNIEFGVNIENLFNAEWNETQFATESRLPFESGSVEEIHFTPGSPFFLKTTLKYSF